MAGRRRAELKLSGVEDLRGACRQYGAALVAAAIRAVEDTVNTVEARARAAAPVGRYPATWSKRKPGRLRDSIKGTVTTDGYIVIGRVRAGAHYAGIVEFGSERVAPHPYLQPAAIAERRKLNARLAALVVELAPEGLGQPQITGEGPATAGVGK